MALRDTLLLVDDQKSGRTILRKIFENSYNLLEAENGEQALLLLEQHQSCIAVMLLDLIMPVMDGFQLLEIMKERGLLLDIPVLIVSSMDSLEYEMRAFDLGASDIIQKPYEPMLVRRRVENIVELNSHKWHLQELVEEQSQTLRHSHDMMVDTLVNLIEHRSLESGQHIRRIRGFAKLLLEDLSLSYPEYKLTPQKIDLICRASALHDIGKISIPDAILNKPGRLTPEEFEIMKTHSATGSQMLVTLPRTGNEDYLRCAHEICRHHHERWDGAGYPDGLAGDAIPLSAQVIGLADAYDALTTKRVYKPALPHEQAAAMILNNECGVFSPKLLDCFRRLSTQFADLAQKYADGLPLYPDILPADTFPVSSAAPDPEAISEPPAVQEDDFALLRYHSLLYYTDATVVEVDTDQGLLHVVYDPNPDFSFLHSADTFHNAIQGLLEHSIHPEDRDRVSLTLPGYLQDILKSGLRQRTLHYRIHNPVTEQYHWYDMTLLRVTSSQERHSFLCVWKATDHAAQTGSSPTSDAAEELSSLSEGMLCCRNDFYFTLEQGIEEELSPLCGYTPKEIAEQFNNHMLDLIHPADQASVHRQLASQLSFGSVVELEYRLRHKNGQSVWVREKSRLFTDSKGVEHLVCYLVDVNQFKIAEDTLRHELDRYRLIYDDSGDVIVEWDAKTDTAVYSSGWQSFFGYEPITQNFTAQLFRASHIHPDELPKLRKKMTAFATVGYQDMEARIAKSDGHYLWCKIRGRAEYAEDGSLDRVVILISNIDEEKQRTQVLRAKSELDSLTKLLNRSSAQQRINERLAETSVTVRSALILVDLDNFKDINERFGHVVGDELLNRVASKLRDMFRSSDIVSRVGGDEFMIFMDSISDDAIVRARCARLLITIHDIFRDVLGDVRPSCSVGVAFVPEHGRTLHHLYRRADMALSEAKAHGRNCYVCYGSELGATVPDFPPAVHTPIDPPASD